MFYVCLFWGQIMVVIGLTIRFCALVVYHLLKYLFCIYSCYFCNGFYDWYELIILKIWTDQCHYLFSILRPIIYTSKYVSFIAYIPVIISSTLFLNAKPNIKGETHIAIICINPFAILYLAIATEMQYRKSQISWPLSYSPNSLA